MVLIQSLLSDGSCRVLYTPLSMMCSTLRNIEIEIIIKREIVLLLFVTVNSPFIYQIQTGFVAVFSFHCFQFKTFAHSCIIIFIK